MPSSYFTKKQLDSWYRKEKLSTYQIADICGCDPKTVYYWLKGYSIPTRPKKIIHTTKRQLEYFYAQGFSMREIGEKLGCVPAAIQKKMKKYGIKARNCWEANVVHKRENFSTNKQEKAYLIGFRIGDLNVKQRSINSFIVIKSNTTKKEQIQLKKQLFGKYGPIWISRSKNNQDVYHFSTSLNNSFSFLLKKHRFIPEWILEKDCYFFSFFAGYTDAEGSIGIYNNMAKFRVGSYDKDLLKQIHKRLLNLKIKNSFLLETRAGTSYKGIKLNGDFWRISVMDKWAVFSCLSRLMPYLKHGKRIKRAKLAISNVLQRI